MSQFNLKLIKSQEWLVSDQYSHGEWGRCEVKNPTEAKRSFEDSRIKPNVFTSSQAILSLLTTGYKDKSVYDNFFSWLNKLRNVEGNWTSASGSLIPSGKYRG